MSKPDPQRKLYRFMEHDGFPWILSALLFAFCAVVIWALH
jgi:hypothetical protein